MENKDLSVIAYANGFTLWQYDGKDKTLEEIVKPNFFRKIWTLTALGDIFLIRAKDSVAQAAVVKLDRELVEIAVMSKVGLNGEA